MSENIPRWEGRDLQRRERQHRENINYPCGLKQPMEMPG